MSFRSGFACIIGRPNAGKSTLTNALVGEKVAITSSRPQTTRHNIRGIVHRDAGQLVLIDTPGLHRPRTLLGERLNALVAETLSTVDLVVMCFPADENIGPGDRFIAGQLANSPKCVAVVTKSDVVGKEALAAQLLAVQELGIELGIAWQHIVPVSALHGDQVELLAELLLAELPEGPPLYPEGVITDEPEVTMVAELIREAALEGLHEELPHSLAVTIEEMSLRPDRPEDRPLLDIYAILYLERESQKQIVIGKGGSRLREIGTAARVEIQRLLGTQVHLDLRVKISRDWQRDPKALSRLGF